jgi:hypothetical protein
MPKAALKSVPLPKTSISNAKDTRTASVLGDLLGRESHTSVNDKFAGMISELAKAKAAIEKKRLEIGGAAGQAVGGVEYGAGDGYFQRYQNGIIYLLPPAAPCWVHGAILTEYLSTGGESGVLGYPTTDEQGTIDGTGRFNHFERGSIFWSYSTGAHEVHGAIRDRWAALGWERSWLGFPKSPEKGYSEDGRISEFEHGNIFWWPDTAAIDLGEVAVRYRGLYCFGEQRGLGADAPYAVLGFAAVPPVLPSAVRSQIQDDVDSGDSRPDLIEIYRGIPGGIALGAWVFEHDVGDPEAYLGLVKQGVALAGKGVSELAGALFGADAVPICQGIWGALAPTITSTVNDLLGTGDDLIGSSTNILTPKEMVLLAGTPRQNFWGIEYHRESELLTDGDASYKVYFDIERV